MYLAQEQFVSVGKSYMVAERFSEFPFAIVFPNHSAYFAEAMSGAEFIGTPAFAQNMAAHAATEQFVDTLAMMVVVALAARLTFNIGGRVLNYFCDKAKQAWKEDKPSFDDTVEAYNIFANVSLQPTPVGTPDRQDKAAEDDVQAPKWFSREIERFNRHNRQNDMKIHDLIQRNDERGRTIAAYNKERLT